MALFENITEDLNKAVLAKDETGTSTLRMVVANLKNAQIAKGEELTDEEIVDEIAKDAKRHRESISAFEGAKRDDLVSKEKAELDVLSRYLPEQIAEADIEKFVDEAISAVKAATVADMGKVMSAVMAKVKGKADGSVVSAIVKRKLTS